MFSRFQSAVEEILQSFEVQQSTQFMRFVQDELAEVTPQVRHGHPDVQHLQKLYELRAKYLDWELGTGYLGFFSHNAGTRYTFTRRMEAVYHLLPPLKPESQILEIGCGAGLLCLDFAQTVKNVFGIDLSFFVLDFANNVKEYLQYDNVLFAVGDAEYLVFPDQRFDLVVCSEVLEHLLLPQNALSEMRRVVKEHGTVIVTTPCAVSLSDKCMTLFRIFNKHIESEKNVHFDKKTYLAIQREGEPVPEETFMRVHERFDYHDLVTMFHNAGFEIEQAVGTVFAFPPHYQVFYRYCPALLLPAVRTMENTLNMLNLFQRFGSVTTCFRLKPIRNT